MKKSICTRSALAALLLAAAASLAACNDQEQKNVAADTSKPAPATIMTTEDPDTFVDPSDDFTVPADELVGLGGFGGDVQAAEMEFLNLLHVDVLLLSS